MKSWVFLGFFFIFVPVFLFQDAVGTLPDVVRETNLLLLGTVAIGLALSRLVRRPFLAPDPFLAPLLVLLVALGLPALSAAYLWDALRGWSLVLIGGIVYLGVARSGMAPSGGIRLLRIVLLCAAFVVAYALLRHFSRPSPAQVLDFLDESLMTEEMRRQMMFAVLLGRAKALFGNPNHLAAFANLLAAAPLALLLAGRGLEWRCLAALSLAGQALLLYLTASRAGMLSFAGGCVAAGLLWLAILRCGRLPAARRTIFITVAVIVLAVSGFLLLGGLRFVRPLLYTETIKTRLVWWKDAAILIFSSPPWGLGLRMFALYFPNVRAIGAPESQFVHNLYLELALAGGPAAVFALFWLQTAAVRAARRVARTRPDGQQAPLLVAAVFGLTAFWLHACFDFVDAQGEIVFLFWFYLGLLGHTAGAGTTARSIKPGAVRAVVASLLLVSVWVILVLVPWQGMSRLAEGKAAVAAKPPRIPRSNRDFIAAARWMPLASPPYYYRACNERFLGGDIAAAVDLMRRAIRRNPRMPHYHGTLAGMLWAAGQRSEALREITTAIRLHPAKPDYYLQRSRYRAELGDTRGAAEDRRRGEFREQAEAVWTPDLEKLFPQP